MILKIATVPPEAYLGGLLVCLVRQGEEGPICCGNPEVDALLSRLYGAGDFFAKEGESLLLYPEGVGEKSGLRRILLIGLGKESLSRELFRKAGGSIAGCAAKNGAEEMLVVLPEEPGSERPDWASALAEGIVLGSYQFKKYKTEEDPDLPGRKIKRVFFYGPSIRGLAAALRRGGIVARAACKARDMANEPANHWTPEHFAKYGRKLAADHGLVCKILDKAKMKRLGMGGILAVSQGSALDPKMVILEYGTGRAGLPTLLLVGKGLTFDSGGISLKPSSGMEEMKYDMCGGAAVLCALQAVVEAKLSGVRLVVMVPSTDNLPGPASIKPGDLIRQYGGKTVEVVNTDAEGRLILADALAYGIEKYRPDAVIDVATLTGAVIIGLGHHRTGLFANDEALASRLIEAGERAGEPLWRLPLGPEYTRQLKSEIADLKNVGKRDGGAITAASFLKEFVGKTPWAHLDIAGTAWDFTEKSYIPKGPSGIAVRTLFELVRSWGKPPEGEGTPGKKQNGEGIRLD